MICVGYDLLCETGGIVLGMVMEEFPKVTEEVYS